MSKSFFDASGYSELTTFDAKDSETTLSNLINSPDESPDYSRILPQPNTFWPTDVSDRLQSVNIRFNSGYGDAPKDVPKMLKMAMLQHAAYFYVNRGDCACTAVNVMEIAPPEAMAVYENNQILLMAL